MKNTLQKSIAESKAIFFDLFHTLASFEGNTIGGTYTHEILGLDRTKWADLLFDSSEDRLKGHKRDPYAILGDLARTINPNLSDATIRIATDNRRKRFIECLEKIKPDNLATLRSLRTAGKKLCLVSNADCVETIGWQTSPLKTIMHDCVFSCDIGAMKPEPEIYREAMKRLGVTPEDSLFVGDGGNDELRGAKQVGMTTIMTIEITSRIWPERIDARRPYSDFIIERISDLSPDEN